MAVASELSYAADVLVRHAAPPCDVTSGNYRFFFDPTTEEFMVSEWVPSFEEGVLTEQWTHSKLQDWLQDLAEITGRQFNKKELSLLTSFIKLDYIAQDYGL